MILFLLIAILSFLAQLLLPWWSMMIVSFLLALFLGRKGGQAFLAGFFGCGIVWLMMALFIQLATGDLLTNRIADLFTLPSPMLLFIVTFFVAAIAGGMAALTGWYLKKIIR